MRSRDYPLVSHQQVRCILIAVILSFGAISSLAQTSVFTYQGRLTDGGTPANGTFDMQFKLYDMLTNGTLQGMPNTITNTTVQTTNGVFTVQLDFGASAFAGPDRFLEISVRHPGDPLYVTLSPRQQLTSTPYAVRSANATVADVAINATQLGGAAANQYVQTNDSRLSDARTPTVGSSNYIQNTNAAQSGSNFNISGNGTVGGSLSGNIVSAAVQYNLGGSRVLSNAGANNTFVGTSAGQNNAGISNTFVGTSAGVTNTTGGGNAFFGTSTGLSNTSGPNNAFFGAQAGQANTTGASNTFVGYQAGITNTTASNNSFFGTFAGLLNSTGINNTFVGMNAGRANTASNNNSFFGFNAGLSNTTGGNNSFFGQNAGGANTAGLHNSFFGDSAGAASTASFNAFFGDSAGLANTTGTANAFFGRAAGLSNTTGNDNSFFGFNAGVSSSGIQNSFFGRSAGAANTAGLSNSFFGYNSGVSNSTGSNNSLFGANAGSTNVAGSNNTFIGAGADASFGSLDHATAIGAGATVDTDSTIVLGRSSGAFDRVVVPGNLQTLGSAEVIGNIRVGILSGLQSQPLCITSANTTNAGTLASCSSSLRYKTDLTPFVGGLAIISRLHPIMFTWKADGTRDVGLGAERVAEVEPMFTFSNKKGEIEGVKYDHLSVVFINAFQEQQAQLEQQQRLIRNQQHELALLKRLVCRTHSRARVCK